MIDIRRPPAPAAPSLCQARTIAHYFRRTSDGLPVHTFGWLACERLAGHEDVGHLSTLPADAGHDAGKLLVWLEQT